MNKIEIITIGLLITMISSVSLAQGMDENQMDQDIEVMESILSQMFFQNNRNNSGWNQVSGNYLPGFGLVFKIPRSKNYFLGSENLARINTILSESYTQSAFDKNVFAKDKIDSIHKAEDNHFKETVKSFFTGYGDLISQLDANDNILVIYGSDIHGQPNYAVNPFIRRRLKNEGVEEIKPASKVTAQVDFEDILSYKKANTTEKQFVKNIRFSEKSLNEAVDQEFIILSGIFEKLYSHRAGSFGHDRPIGFERIDGLGVIYEMSLRLSLLVGSTGVSAFSIASGIKEVGDRKDRANIYTIPEKYNEKMDAYKKQREKAYLELKLKLKQDLIRYGKTLKSLQADEILMMATKMSDCLSCDQPEKLNLIVKGSVLKDYNQQKITLEQAVESITEKEISGESKW